MNKLLLAAPLALAVAAGTAQAQTLVATSNCTMARVSLRRGHHRFDAPQ